MKTLIGAIAICFLIVASSVFGAIFTDKKLSDFEEDISSAIPDAIESAEIAYAGAKIIEEEYASIKKYLFLFIHDDEVREIEEHVADIQSAAMTDELSDVIGAKNRLKLHIEQLRRLSKFSIEAIF